MAKVLFISEKDLKENSLINENVNMALLTPIIEKCQDMHVQTILGTDLFKDLKTSIEAAEISEEYNTLLIDYIQPCLRWYIMADLPEVLSFKLLNKGTLQQGAENATPADLSDILRMMDKYRRNAEFYGQRITQFLCANQTDYPKYREISSPIDNIRPNESYYETGIYLGHNHRREHGY